MRDLADRGLLEIGLGRFDQAVDLLGAVVEPRAEERVEHDAQHEPAADREQVDDAGLRKERLVNRAISFGNDHRRPTVEPPAREAGLHGAPSSAVVVAVRHDHGAVADVEPEHIETEAPEKRVGRGAVDLRQVLGLPITTMRTGPASISNVAPSSPPSASSVGHGSPVRPRSGRDRGGDAPGPGNRS